jgi:hypothetical protein
MSAIVTQYTSPVDTVFEILINGTTLITLSSEEAVSEVLSRLCLSSVEFNFEELHS